MSVRMNQPIVEDFKNSTPKGWKKQKLSEMVLFIGGNAFKSTDTTENGIKWLKIANVGFGKVDWSTKSYLPLSFSKSYSKYLLSEDDVVMALTRPILGDKLKIAKVRQSDTPALLNQRVAKLVPNEGYDLIFLYYILSKRSTVLKIENAIAGTDPPNLGFNDLKKVKVIVPTNIVEQQKIASILSTWDKAIELKEKLIEQKKEQKKGLMQKLLTGEVRLPGFDGEWERATLNDLGEFKTSSVDKKVNKNEEDVSLINYMDVYRNNVIDESINFMKVSATTKQIETFSVQYGDVLFTPSSETPDDIGHSAVVKLNSQKKLFSYHLVRLRFNREMDIDFKAYIFNSSILLKEFSRRATGATRYTLSLSDFREATIKIPKDISEQKAIGTLLLNSDKEIDLLVKELSLLKQQKQGLMQRLLTGKVRVKV